MPGGSSEPLADVLDRVLDKGVAVVGDMAVNVVDLELITLRLRPFVAPAQPAPEMDLDVSSDPFFAPGAAGRTGAGPRPDRERAGKDARPRIRLRELEAALVAGPTRGRSAGPRRSVATQGGNGD